MNENLNSLEVGEKRRSFLESGDIKIPKETYRILGYWLTYVLSIVFIVLSVTFLIVGITNIIKYSTFSIHYFLLPIVLILITCIITYFFPFYSSITVDMSNKIVICRKYKLFFIIRKIVRIETQNIAKVYTEKNLEEGIGSDEKNSVDGFNLVFELNNGEKIIGLEGEINKDYEMIKVGYFMSKFFQGLETSEKPELIPSTEEKA